MDEKIAFSIAKIIYETDWHEQSSIIKDHLHISQFQGTIFLSDYQCYKVECDGKIIVVKFTNELEYSILRYLNEDGFLVPFPICSLKNDTLNVNVLFEEFLCGIELNLDSPKDIWQEVAIQLANLHLKYWGIDRIDVIPLEKNTFNDIKIRRVLMNPYIENKWENVIKKIVHRYNEIPHTLIHGDAFPTNFLIHEKCVSFIDLANASIMPYAIDIARLTCLPNFKDENTFLCPFKEEVLNAYYDKIQTKLGLSKEDFLIDVKLASFIELTAIYEPPITMGGILIPCKTSSNIAIEQLLNNLVKELT